MTFVVAQFIAPANGLMNPGVINHAPTKRNRQSMRLRGYDYGQCGAYFITICTQQLACLFGDVVEEAMVLNEAGRVVESVWDELPNHYPNVALDAFVVMPNHVHGVIVIEQGVMNPGVMNPGVMNPGVMNHAPTQNEHGVGAQYIAPDNVLRLGKIVRSFKAKSTFLINQHRQTPGLPIWQRGYYDHIVRNEADLTRIRDYIANNPARWMTDENNPSADSSNNNAGAINHAPTKNERKPP